MISIVSFEYNGIVSNTVGFKNVTSKKQIYNVNTSTNNGNLIKKKLKQNKVKFKNIKMSKTLIQN